jgi:L-threonylcarbamoyladenylate synthase
MDTKVVKMSNGALGDAVNILKSGSPVVYPTETFYGLGVDPYNEDAVRSIFEIKGREESKPIS